MHPYFKISKADAAKFQKLHEHLAQRSETIKESEHSYLYFALPGKMSLMIEKLKETNVPYNIVSETQLHKEGN